MFKENKIFTLSSLTAVIFYSATFAIGYILSLFFQSVKGLAPQSAGLFLASLSIIQTLFSPIAGKLSDKFEPRIVASIGLILDAIGLFLFTLLEEGTPLVFIISLLVLLGLGHALFSSPNTNAIMSSVERKSYGVAAGMVGTMRYIGQMLSMNITTFIFTIYIGEVQITPEYYNVFLSGIRAAFMIFTILCILGIAVSFLRGKVRRT